ncbi:hypothetical protein [Mycobacteroides abscessus]|uniref:hypothetical protein n=1 Tax=Mycobacteroides abscessus TaxID=36809 RepID=UPI00092BCD3D|nr:hypothetical protein [Mycobacteroides abscessus]SHW32971.1 Uncharacterised protein [Mycobacteroides abscessus subsp. abscessus]SIA07340.1 Uncharacterised protein [Mycobacteroides abscessus subsp. abscessus]SKR55928.1 Uncharacterised protein [Mycobacteroides abscessus subsp. abscessus]
MPDIVTPEVDSNTSVDNPGNGDPVDTNDSLKDDEDSFKPIVLDSQDAVNAFMQKRISRVEKKYEGFEDFKAKASQFDQLEAEKGSDIEKLTRRADKAEKERDALQDKVAKAERAELVRDIADELGLPKKLIGRVRGDSEDDIRADIADLLESVPSPKTDSDSKDEKDAGDGPPSGAPKSKLKFAATGDETDALNVSADDVLKRVPRGGGV